MTPLPRHPTLLVAVAASAAAGMVHAAAAGAHSDDGTLAALFVLAAILQVGWAATALAVPARAVVLGGVLLQSGIVAVWAASRTTGIGLVGGLTEPQDVAFQDGAAAGLQLVAAFAGAALLGGARSIAEGMAGRRPARSRALAGVVVGAIAALAVPAMAFPHEHDHDGDVVDVALGAAATPGEHARAPSDGHAHDDPGDHAHDAPTVGSTAVDARLAGAPGFEGSNDEQRRRAVDLIDATAAAIARFADPAAAEAAGYTSIGDGFTGHDHFVNHEHLADPAVLDPATIESLVYRVLPDGTRELVSGMYILPPGTTMADVPDVGGRLTTWHDHQNLCWNEDGTLAGVLVDGHCRPGGTFRATPPMLHVWIVEHPCGPFAGIEGGHGSGCAAHDHG